MRSKEKQLKGSFLNKWATGDVRSGIGYQLSAAGHYKFISISITVMTEDLIHPDSLNISPKFTSYFTASPPAVATV